MYFASFLNITSPYKNIMWISTHLVCNIFVWAVAFDAGEDF